MSARCPDCEAGLLNTPRVLKQRKKRVSMTVPFKICMSCRVVIVTPLARSQKWRFWDGDDFMDLSGDDG